MLNPIQSMSRGQKRIVLLAVDAVTVMVALSLSFAVMRGALGEGWNLIEVLAVLPYVIALALAISYFGGFSKVPLRENDASSAGPAVLFAGALSLASYGMSMTLGLSYPLGLHIVFGLSFFLFFTIGRVLILRFVTFVYSRSRGRCRVLIYGAGATGAQLAIALRRHESFEPVAFVDDNVNLQGLRILRLPVHPPSRISELVRDKRVDRVMLATDSMSQASQIKVSNRLEAMNLEVQVLPSFAQLIGEAPLIEKLMSAKAQSFLGRDEVSESWRPETNCYQDRVVMITGAGGSIGSELCRQLLELHPAKLVVFELSELALYNILQELQAIAEKLPVEIAGVLGSVTETRQVRKVMQEHGVQVVLHAAAYKHVPLVEENPLAGLVNNVLGTQTLVQQSLLNGVERFILISSDKAVRPTNVMGASKRLAEAVMYNAARHSDGVSGPVFATVRFGNVLGSSGSVVPLFQEQLSRGGPVTVTDPNVMRYFMTVQEAVKLVLESGSMAQGNEVFVLDMGEPVSILQLARQVIEHAGYSVKDDANPDGEIEIKITGLRKGEKLVEELTLTNNLNGTSHPKILSVVERNLSETDIATALRRLREAFVASNDNLARDVAMQFVEPAELTEGTTPEEAAQRA